MSNLRLIGVNTDGSKPGPAKIELLFATPSGQVRRIDLDRKALHDLVDGAAKALRRLDIEEGLIRP